MSVNTSPFMDVLVVSATPNTPASIQSLIAALPASRQPAALSNPSSVLRASYILITADPNGGTANFYIGNSSSMTATVSCGTILTKGQQWNPPTMGANVYLLDRIFLMSDTASAKFYLCYVCR